MPLDLLPTRSDSAAANMAADFLMLQHYPANGNARWRHYHWHRPAVTFGYAQRIKDVRAQLGDEARELELCRRPTGGGIVDHRHDWTYALVIPPKHDLGAAPAPVSYAAVHEAIAACLNAAGCPAKLQSTEKKPAAANRAAVCFSQAEPADVIHAETGQKLAGAAQKRGKRGLLFQGSLSREATGVIDWDEFEHALLDRLADLLGMPAQTASWPEPWDETVDALAEDYASEGWLERR